MSTAFRGERLHIAILGRCNTGKSTLLNLLAGQEASIVSAQPGTTGDPVPLAFELHPLGPVTFYDTAGLDESSAVGVLRRQAGRKVLARADMAMVVTDEAGVGALEKELIGALEGLETPFLLVFNKADVKGPSAEDLDWCAENNIHCLTLAAVRAADAAALREALVRLAPDLGRQPALLADLLAPGSTVVCVTPLDASAPKGRLIAPQVQALRELLDHHHLAVAVQPPELPSALDRLRQPPDLVITDSQAVREVNARLPPAVRLTTFSILFARLKGDFGLLLQGTRHINDLPDKARILVAEACSHHPQDDDIARVKIPRLLKTYTGHDFQYVFAAGRDFPDDLAPYDLAIMCGGCMLNPGEMKRRLRVCAAYGLPVSNFGMVISLAQGILERVTEIFR